MRFFSATLHYFCSGRAYSSSTFQRGKEIDKKLFKIIRALILIFSVTAGEIELLLLGMFTGDSVGHNFI